MEKDTMMEQALPETEETVAAEETPEQTQVPENETPQVTEETEEDENEETEEVAEQAPVVVERPMWQRVGALIALVLFVALILMYYVNIARGGR